MKREELITAVENKILRSAYVLYALSLLGIVSSPLVWIWHSWNYAWKILLTSLISFIALNCIIYFVSNIIEKQIDKYLDSTEGKSSKFLMRMDEIIKKNNLKK